MPRVGVLSQDKLHRRLLQVRRNHRGKHHARGRFFFICTGVCHTSSAPSAKQPLLRIPHHQSRCVIQVRLQQHYVLKAGICPAMPSPSAVGRLGPPRFSAVSPSQRRSALGNPGGSLVPKPTPMACTEKRGPPEVREGCNEGCSGLAWSAHPLRHGAALSAATGAPEAAISSSVARRRGWNTLPPIAAAPILPAPGARQTPC